LYKVKNDTDGPIVISEWRMFIAGKKIIDLEIHKTREEIEHSKELKQLIDNGYLKIVEKSPYSQGNNGEINEDLANKVAQLETILGQFKGVLEQQSQNPAPTQQPAAPAPDMSAFLDQMRDIVQNAQVAGGQGDSVEYARDKNDVLVQKLVDAKIKSMADKDKDIDSNFEEIGEKQVKKSNVNDLLKELEGI